MPGDSNSFLNPAAAAAAATTVAAAGAATTRSPQELLEWEPFVETPKEHLGAQMMMSSTEKDEKGEAWIRRRKKRKKGEIEE